MAENKLLCSFNFISRVTCSTDTVIPLTSCLKDISGHKTSLKFGGVDTEKELILSRSGLFSLRPNEEKDFNICSNHRSYLGLNWVRTSSKCQIPQEIAKHKKGGKADRGISQHVSMIVYRLTSKIIPLGSGMHSGKTVQCWIA